MVFCIMLLLLVAEIQPRFNDAIILAPEIDCTHLRLRLQTP